MIHDKILQTKQYIKVQVMKHNETIQFVPWYAVNLAAAQSGIKELTL